MNKTQSSDIILPKLSGSNKIVFKLDSNFQNTKISPFYKLVQYHYHNEKDYTNSLLKVSTESNKRRPDKKSKVEENYFAGFFRQDIDINKLMKNSVITYKKKNISQIYSIKKNNQKSVSPQPSKYLKTDSSSQSIKSLNPTLSTKEEIHSRMQTHQKSKSPKELVLKFKYITSKEKHAW